MTHQIKTWPGEFEAVRTGRKCHEVRRNDRGYCVGDFLILKEWNPATEQYTGRAVLRRVTYLTPSCAWGLPKGICVMSLGGDTTVRKGDAPAARTSNVQL